MVGIHIQSIETRGTKQAP